MKEEEEEEEEERVMEEKGEKSVKVGIARPIRQLPEKVRYFLVICADCQTVPPGTWRKF